MKRMQDEKDFNNLQDDVNDLKNQKYYTHSIFIYEYNEALKTNTKVASLSITIDSEDEFTLQSFINKYKNKKIAANGFVLDNNVYYSIWCLYVANDGNFVVYLVDDRPATLNATSLEDTIL